MLKGLDPSGAKVFVGTSEHVRAYVDPADGDVQFQRLAQRPGTFNASVSFTTLRVLRGLAVAPAPTRAAFNFTECGTDTRNPFAVRILKRVRLDH